MILDNKSRDFFLSEEAGCQHDHQCGADIDPEEIAQICKCRAI